MPEVQTEGPLIPEFSILPTLGHLYQLLTLCTLGGWLCMLWHGNTPDQFVLLSEKIKQAHWIVCVTLAPVSTSCSLS